MPMPIPFIILILLCLTAGCGGSDEGTVAETTPPETTPTPTPTPDPSSSCEATTTEVNWQALMSEDCPSLSQYGLFVDPSIPTSSAVAPGLSYQLSTELFSNYASKYRFIFVPEGQSIKYVSRSTFEMPVGTVLVKTFALPFDTQINDANNQVLIETRLLIHRQTGWTTLPYLWQDGEATLQVAGKEIAHTLNHKGQSQRFAYQVPSRAECKLCHQTNSDSSQIEPIGLKAHLLNRDVSYQGNQVNQLQLWQQQGLLQGLPQLNQVGKTYDIFDDSAALTARAKGYLDVNCAHCHNPQGFASISGLRLGFYVDHTSFEYGICKQPPGWDGGARGLSYDIIPGDGEHSILVYRQELNEPKDRMPPVGRAIAHTDAVALIKQWIDEMPAELANCQQ
ncbi:SO2930 family diheme c-type cytochrome [Shewanella fidelis]|uniref:SO2930 family diheme c-type cytochrome n=1 Tax=Shewanella fidelis TaxID=173509 RepID=UPI00049113D5